ncbi:restriction endonuclease [Nocardia gipuzkoensis]|uniref:restriction endonuclease n=1 Tax=Nocardia gipuzkoensis TaxID=2749991 RepID=UPI003EE12D92
MNGEISLVPCYDIVVANGAEQPGMEMGVGDLDFGDTVSINGIETPRRSLPDFAALDGYETFDNHDLETLAGMPFVQTACPFCKTSLETDEFFHPDPFSGAPEDVETNDFLTAVNRLGFCSRCRYWQISNLQAAWGWYRADHWANYQLTTASSKLREFNDAAPEGTLAEIAQWFRRHPSLYQTVTPNYLEKLVARVFRELDTYVEVRHVGRPDDGGVDVILVEDEARTWLVQVKRRESANSSEGVSTVRNLLGSLVLNKESLGVVVSTADHFTYRARQAVQGASEVGYTVRLTDRSAFDALLARALPEQPWRTVMRVIGDNQTEFFNSHLKENSHVDPEYVQIFDLTKRLYDMNQLPLF